jgi:hypothetical protein
MAQRGAQHSFALRKTAVIGGATRRRAGGEDRARCASRASRKRRDRALRRAAMLSRVSYTEAAKKTLHVARFARCCTSPRAICCGRELHSTRKIVLAKIFEIGRIICRWSCEQLHRVEVLRRRGASRHHWKRTATCCGARCAGDRMSRSSLSCFRGDRPVEPRPQPVIDPVIAHNAIRRT